MLLSSFERTCTILGIHFNIFDRFYLHPPISGEHISMENMIRYGGERLI